MNSCPICKSKNISKTLNAYAFKRPLTNKYITSLSGINFYQCNDCLSGWRDGDDALTHLYSVSHAQHNKGFSRFIQLLQGPTNEYFFTGIEAILKLVWEFYGHRFSVLELGCPMNSIGQLFNDMSTPPKNKFKIPRTRKGLQLLFSIVDLVPFLLTKLIILYGSLKSILFSKKSSVISLNYNHSEILSNLDFMQIPSAFGWGANCNIAGNSCFTSSQIFTPYRQLVIPSICDKVYDICFSLNFIDHSQNPVDYVKFFTKKASIFIFNVHKQSYAGPQHKFTISSHFSSVINHLPENLKCCLLDKGEFASESVLTFIATASPQSPLFKLIVKTFSSSL